MTPQKHNVDGTQNPEKWKAALKKSFEKLSETIPYRKPQHQMNDLLMGFARPIEEEDRALGLLVKLSTKKKRKTAESFS